MGKHTPGTNSVQRILSVLSDSQLKKYNCLVFYTLIVGWMRNEKWERQKTTKGGE